MWGTASFWNGVGLDTASFKSTFKETLEFKTCFKMNQNFENVILILNQEDLSYFETRMGRHHWGMVTSENEVCKPWIRVPLGEFGLSLSFDDSWQWVFGRHKCGGSTEEFIKVEYSPYESICRERFPDRFVLKKNSLTTDALRSIVSLENDGVIGHFSEVASPVKAPLGKLMRPDVIPVTPEVGKGSTGGIRTVLVLW